MARNVTNFFGIVVKRQRYRERDSLVTILTREYGFRTFLVRGTQTGKSKLSGSVIPFSYGDYTGLVKNEGLSYINSASNIKQFDEIIKDIELNAYATFLFDLVRLAFMEERIPDSWYKTIFKALMYIDNGSDGQIIVNIIQMHLLEVFGVAPNMDSCVVGGETAGKFDFSVVLGGIICSKHYANDPNRLHIPEKIVYFLRLFSKINIDQVGKIELKETNKDLIQHAIDSIYSGTVGPYPKSKLFIDKMKSWHV
ncbi:DNA repair protein RecO [Companilactobacillus mishanensis]|uniref:DNA repair protein RecO n=1 Tax=Companilactobacillus mishanensis TaxID=2486008 RepID=A0A5P0ZEV4_9LACO|nr:DNA repair protein RecO [Companilactobacillus mishanensis]MQS44318.1 DNA repair protein RecO [Companilactobacillus mishanensis]MQS51580.1 DNA repair protein RecO [Companilactobacillus mishanensis]MQS88558.1 DNA repair protein RecO [Companilactobacillus mishanensis]